MLNATTRKVAISPKAIVMPKNSESRFCRERPSFLIMTIPLCMRKKGTISIARKIKRSRITTAPLIYETVENSSASSVEDSARKRR